MSNKDAIVTLKVLIESSGAAKAMRFGLDMSVGEVVKEIREKTGVGKDHGMFVPKDPETKKNAYWLAKNRTLRYYGLTNNKDVTFKKIHRPLRIRLVDDTRKMVVINDSETVGNICSVIGQKIGLKSWEEFSLRRPPTSDENGVEKSGTWLNDAETLHQQGIEETDELEYDKRYFYNDDFVDKDDPFSLHLLYVGANKDVVNGKYQITRNDARDFAALQMQVVYGDHDPTKHKPGWVKYSIEMLLVFLFIISMAEFYPPQYRKDKKIEKETYVGHKKLIGTRDMNAKFRYVQLVRSNKSYGVTWFECKQPIKGKKKPLIILVGVTKAKIIKAEAETFRIIKSWEWSQMRRWSSVRNTFTLEFGDYEDDSINVVCDRAEELSTLIAGYIELILRTRVDPSRVLEDSEDDIAEAEQMEVNYGMANQGMVGSYSNPYGQGAGMGGMGQGRMGMWPQANAVNVEDLNSAIRATEFLSNELGTIKGNWGSPQGMSEAEWLKQYEKHRGNITAGINDMLGQARLGLNNLNRNNLDARSKEMVMEMMSMATAARNIAAYNNDQAPLLDGAKAVADSLAGLMNLLGNAMDNPDDYAETLEEALKAAEKLFQGAEALMNISITDFKLDKGAELLVADIIANIDLTLEDLLMKAKYGSDKLTPEKKAELQAAITRLQAIKGLALAQMKQLAPVLQTPEAQKHMKIAAATLGSATDGLSGRASALGVENAQDISDAVLRINRALEMLLNADKLIETKGLAGDVDLYGPVQQLITDLAAVRGTLDDPRSVIGNVKAAANDQNAIIEAIQALSDGADAETQARLQKSADALTHHIEELMDGTRVLVKDPSESNREAVVNTVNDLEKLALQLIGDSGTATAVNNLRYAAKVAVASLLKLTTTSAIYYDDVADKEVRVDLRKNVDASNDNIAELVSKIQAAAADPRNFNVQSQLLDTALFQLPNYAELVGTAKTATDHISDSKKKQNLELISTESSSNLRLLAQAVANVSSLSGDAALEAAFAEFDIIRADLESARVWADAGKLKPVPGSTKASAEALVSLGAKELRDQVAVLSNEARNGYVTGLTNPIEQAAQAFQQIAGATRPLAVATSADRRAQVELIEKVQNALEATVANISIARALAADKKNKAKNSAIDRAEKKFNDEIDKLEALSEGLANRDISAALLNLNTKLQLLGSKMSLNPDLSYDDYQKSVLDAIKAMDVAVGQVTVTSLENPDALSYAAGILSATAGHLLEAEARLIAAAGKGDTADALTKGAKEITNKTIAFLQDAQVAANDRNGETEGKLLGSEAQVYKHLDKMKALIVAGNPLNAALGEILETISRARDGLLEVVPGTAADILSEVIAETQELKQCAADVVVASGRDSSAVLSKSEPFVNAANALLGTAYAATISDGSGKYASLDGARIVIGAELIAKNPSNDSKAHTIARQMTQAAGNLITEAKARARTEADSSKRAAIVKNAQALIVSASQLARTAGNKNSDRNGREISKAATEVANKSIELENSIRSGKKVTDTVDRVLAKRLLSKAYEVALCASDLLQSGVDHAGKKDKQAEINAKNTDLEMQLTDFKEIVGALNPAVQAADAALSALKKSSVELEASLASCKAGNLTGELRGLTLSEHQALLAQGVAALKKDVDAVVSTANAGPEAVAAAVNNLKYNAAGTVNSVTLTAVATVDDEIATKELSLGKGVVDALSELVKAIQASNLHDPTAETLLANTGKASQQALGLLEEQLKAASAPLADLDQFRKKIIAALATLSEPSDTSSSYAANRVALLENVRDLAKKATSLLSVDKANGTKTRAAIVALADSVPALVESSRSCAATSAEENTKGEILSSANSMGEAAANMVAHAKSVAEGKSAQPQLLIAYNDTIAAVSQLLDTTKKGATGELKIEKALKENGTALVSVATSAMFAEAEQLEVAQAPKAPLAALLDKLVADTKSVAASASAVAAATKGTDDDLGNASLTLARNATEIAASADQTLSRLGAADQKAAFVATKDILLANQQLLTSARAVQRNPNDSGASRSLATANDAVIQGVKRLHDALNKANGAQSSLAQQLEQQKQRILALENSTASSSAEIEDVNRAARTLLKACADLSFSTSDSATIAAAVASANTSTDLAAKVNGAKSLSEDASVKQAMTESTVGVVKAVAGLVEVAKKNRDDDATKAEMAKQSANVSAAVNRLANALNGLPDVDVVEEKGADWDAIAEAELIKCAEVIAKAAATLSKRPPKKDTAVPGVIDQDDINGAILDGAGAIAAATGMLVKAAAASQQERMSKKTIGKSAADATWANGLISAAQGVSGAVSQLVKSANESVAGKAQEEALVAAAKAVGAATSHLVAASRSKGDPKGSKHQQSLKAAAKAVSEATAQLVAAAHTAAQFQEEETINFESSGGKAQELEQQMAILRLEKELNKARRVLELMRNVRK